MSLGEALLGSAVAGRSAVAVMPVVSGGGDASKDGSIRYAMAMEVKYRKHKKFVQLGLLGVHNANRAGVYPGPDRVVQLGIKILLEGCNPNEANHEGVCVQEVPPEKRAHRPQFPEEPFETMTAFNTRHCRGSGELRKCFPEPDVQYGTLAHSHLLLVLLCLAHGAVWPGMPDQLKEKLLDWNGAFDYAAVAGFDPNIAHLIDHGLEMEVLGHEICLEEPGAAVAISTVINETSSMALKTTEITAMASLAGHVVVEAGASVAGQVHFESVREKLRHELGAATVDDPDFIQIFSFCISLGGKKNKFIPEILRFATRYVNSELRSLRLSAFEAINAMPGVFPYVETGLVIRAYCKAPCHGVRPSPEPAWGKEPPRAKQTIN